jgi:hypothetical protein
MRLEAGVGDEPGVAPVDPDVGVVRVDVAHALGAAEPARVEELGELPVGDLVALEPEVADVDAVSRRLVRSARVPPHPERAGLDEHDAVGPRDRRSAARPGASGPIVASASTVPGTRLRRAHAITRPR